MNIGIIGAGRIGESLTRLLAGLGHSVRVANSRAPETLADLTAETGATAVWAADAASDADLIIVSVPQKNVLDLGPAVVGVARTGVPIIDTNNYSRERDGRIEAIEAGMPSSVWVSEQLGVSVVKAINTIFWRHLLELGVPHGEPGRIALPVAGDDPAGKRIVSDLIDQLGFDPVDGGTLAESWRQESGMPVWGANLDAAAAIRALADASPEVPRRSHGHAE
jgi:predicted dinucleotide-binding enzyme